MEHFHEKGGVGGVPLHVLEIQEILPSLGHRPENTEIIEDFGIFCSDFTSAQGFGLTAGCTSPENRNRH